ncbi:MAG: hypothetical protein HQM07_09710 [Zetaproteobacteria bacterium]|nr:hypothetical protein [Zetaproteobacteria bacterium]
MGQPRLACGCPAHFPKWHNQDIDLGATLVHEQGAPMFLHMPIGYEASLDRQLKDIQRLGLHEQWPGFGLTQSAMFRGKILAPLEEASSLSHKTYRLSNPYMLRVRLFKGDIGGIKKTVKEIQSSLLDEGKMPKELFLSYLTCPQCQEKRGGMQLMVLRHWIQSDKLQQKIRQQAKNTKN